VKKNGRHETSPAVVRAASRDNVIAAIFAGVPAMTAKTPAQRQEDLRARRLLLGLTEVRGIYAHPEDHKAIKEYAAKLQGLDNRKSTSDNQSQA